MVKASAALIARCRVGRRLRSRLDRAQHMSTPRKNANQNLF